MIWLAVLLGGAVGAPARYLVDRGVTRWKGTGFPWATLAINVCGSLLLGVLAALAVRGHLSTLPFAAGGAGFCGAFTTFSTFTWEALALAEDGFRARAAAYMGLSVVLGLGAAALGYGVGRPI